MSWTSLKRTTAPGGAVVTTAEAKAHLRVVHSADDATIADLVAGATGWVEKECNRALAEQTWAMTLDGFPSDDAIRLPVAQLVSVAVAYLDVAGASQTLSPSAYVVVSDEFGGHLHLAPDQAWPATADRPDAVTVTTVVGYPKVASDYGVNVPSALKSAIKIRAELGYGQFSAAEADAKERAIQILLAGFKVLQR